MPKKIRVYELAHELGLTNKEALDLCLSLGMGVKSHSSSIEDAQADRARRKADREGLRRPVQPEEPAPRPRRRPPRRRRRPKVSGRAVRRFGWVHRRRRPADRPAGDGERRPTSRRSAPPSTATHQAGGCPAGHQPPGVRAAAAPDRLLAPASRPAAAPAAPPRRPGPGGPAAPPSAPPRRPPPAPGRPAGAAGRRPPPRPGAAPAAPRPHRPRPPPPRPSLRRGRLRARRRPPRHRLRVHPPTSAVRPAHSAPPGPPRSVTGKPIPPPPGAGGRRPAPGGPRPGGSGGFAGRSGGPGSSGWSTRR